VGRRYYEEPEKVVMGNDIPIKEKILY